MNDLNKNGGKCLCQIPDKVLRGLQLNLKRLVETFNELDEATPRPHKFDAITS
jgi:hypothetical protein